MGYNNSINIVSTISLICWAYYMKLIIYLLLFFSIPVIMGLVSGHRAGVMWYQKKCSTSTKK